MGLLDSLKKGLKVLAEKTGQAIDNFAKNQQFKSVVGKLKLELATRFSKDQLEKVAALENIPLYIEKPIDPYDPFAGYKKVRLRTKVDIAKRVASRLTFNELVEYARKFKVPYKDLEEERERAYREIFGVQATQDLMETVENATEEETGKINTVPEKQDDKLLEVVSALHNELGYMLRPVRDEKEFKSQVFSFLVGKFGAANIREEYPIAGRKVDIVAFGDIAIELKIARSASALNNLIGEVFKLKSAGVPKIVAVVLDIGKYPNLHTDVEQLKQLGTHVVVIRGRMKEPRSRKIEVKFK